MKRFQYSKKKETKVHLESRISHLHNILYSPASSPYLIKLFSFGTANLILRLIEQSI